MPSTGDIHGSTDNDVNGLSMKNYRDSSENGDAAQRWQKIPIHLGEGSDESNEIPGGRPMDSKVMEYLV